MTAETSSEATRVRIDRRHPRVHRAQIEVARAVHAAVADAELDRRLIELVNIRVSQLNGCASCLDVHVRKALRAGDTTQRIAVLPAWRDTTLFTNAERAALILAESLTTLPDARSQEADYVDAARHLSGEQLSALSWVIIAINAFNRVSIVSQHRVGPEPATPIRTDTSDHDASNTGMVTS